MAFGKMGARGGFGSLGVLGRAGGSALWTPLNLGTALVAWWDAQDTAHIALSGSNVTSWTDKVSAIPAAQATPANQPTWSATARNGKPGLVFNGTSQLLTFNPTLFPAGAAARTISVAGFFNSTGQGYALSYGINSAGSVFNILANSTVVSLFDGTAVFSSAESWGSVDRFVSVGMSAAGAGTFNVDGLAAEAFTDTTLTTGSTTGIIGAYINGAVAFWNGPIQQIVVANRVLTTLEQNKIDGWESWYDGKAGSNLPVGHPYKLRAPLVSDIAIPVPNLTNVFAAYSLRRVTSYTGPLVRIRNSSTTVEQDFSYGSDGWVSAAAVASFLGGAAGTISKWYDQGVGGRDVVQATVANQPTFTPKSYGPRPGLLFNGTTSALANASVAWATSDLMLFVVANAVQEIPTYRSLFCIAPLATSGIDFEWNNQALSDWQAGDGRAVGNGYNAGVAPRAVVTAPNFSNGFNNQHDMALAAGGVDWTTNGTTNALRVAVAGQVPAVSGAMTVSLNFSGTIGEVIVFNTAYSARTSLRTSQKAAWIDVGSVGYAMWGDSLTFGGQDGSATTVPSVLASSFLPAVKNVVNEGVSSNTSSQILTRFQANPQLWQASPIIWAGVNNLAPGSISTALTQVQSDIATMISTTTSSRYLVLSIINQEIWPSGSATYNQLIALNSALSNTYGSQYLDVRAALSAAYNPANPVDVIDLANDVTPFTLRAKNSGTLSGAITNATTSFSIAGAAAIFPGGILQIGSEYIYVIAGSGTSITNCTRGYAGSTAAGYSSGQAFTYTDGLHLGGNGYTVVANTIFSKIQALGGW